jgi:hypothetical protein
MIRIQRSKVRYGPLSVRIAVSSSEVVQYNMNRDVKGWLARASGNWVRITYTPQYQCNPPQARCSESIKSKRGRRGAAP